MNQRNTIWKFPLPIKGPEEFKIEMPQGAKILTLQMQNGKPMLWVSFDLELREKCHDISRFFSWKTTGQEFVGWTNRYVGTILDGSLVFHLYETVMKA